MSKDAAGQLPVERRNETARPVHATDGGSDDVLEAPDRRLVAGVARDARRGDSGPPLQSRQLMALQRSIGNRAVSDLMAGRPSSRAAASQGLGPANANPAPRLAVQRHPGPTMPQEIEPGTGTGTGGGLDYVAIATRIRDAIEGLGTDRASIPSSPYRHYRRCCRYG